MFILTVGSLGQFKENVYKRVHFAIINSFVLVDKYGTKLLCSRLVSSKLGRLD